MKLPEIGPKTFKHTFAGCELTFRKFRVQDSELIDILTKKAQEDNESDLKVTFRTLAHFMEGYEETLDERTSFLEGLSWDSYTDVEVELIEVMAKIGMAKTDGSKKAQGLKTPKTSKK